MRLAPRSLAGRLLLGSAAATLVVLAVVLVLLHLALTRFVTGQIDQRLDNKIVALASQLRTRPDGTLSLDGEADGPPFDEPRHRSFWIVEGPRNTLRTRWLAGAEAAMPPRRDIDDAFSDPPPPAPEGGDAAAHPRTLATSGLGGIALHERIARRTLGGLEATILVATPAETIAGPVGEAMTRLGVAVLALGGILGAIAFAQVRLGLRPLARLRAEVAEVAEGRRALLPAAQPTEIAPLVGEVNRLLERNAVNLDQARRHVANLAHGLKTPLATLQLGVERLDDPGKNALLPLLAQIDLRVRHHLGRARAGALAGTERARTPLMPRLADLGEALTRIHADRGLTLALDGSADLVLACEAHDVDEIFGNLLDNAFKFARHRIGCRARRDGRTLRVVVEDDGPGLAPDQLSVVTQPGRRLDESIPGFGFGLAIARELVELYGGELRLEAADTGLAATVILPGAAAERSG